MKRLLFCFFCFFSATFANAQQSVLVEPANAVAGKSSIYKMEFALPDSLPPHGAIVVVFPSEFDLSGVNIGASSKIKGGFNTFVVQREVILVRKGNGAPHKSGEKVDVWLSAVKNPSTQKVDYSTQIYVYQNGEEIASAIKANSYKPRTNPKLVKGSFTLTAKN